VKKPNNRLVEMKPSKKKKLKKANKHYLEHMNYEDSAEIYIDDQKEVGHKYIKEDSFGNLDCSGAEELERNFRGL